MRAIFLLLAFAFAYSTAAQDAVRLEATQREADYYPSVRLLASSERIWHEEEDSSPDEWGYNYRVVVITSEIYDSIIVERIRYGVEGCCTEITSAQWLDMYALADHFALDGELGGISDLAWSSATTFEFSLRGRHFVVSDIEGDTMLVTEI